MFVSHHCCIVSTKLTLGHVSWHVSIASLLSLRMRLLLACFLACFYNIIFVSQIATFFCSLFPLYFYGIISASYLWSCSRIMLPCISIASFFSRRTQLSLGPVSLHVSKNGIINVSYKCSLPLACFLACFYSTIAISSKAACLKSCF
jgi:hypothetical protein